MQHNRFMELYDKRKQSVHTVLRQQVIEHCGTVCANCGSDQDIEYHHIVPLSNGGTNQVGNFVALCFVCHLKAHGKLKYRNVWSRDNELKMDRPDGADEIIEKFLKGEIGKHDACCALGIDISRSLHKVSFFRSYLERHSIVSYMNFVDLKKNQRANREGTAEEIKYLASIVIYYDGTEERYYRTMKDGRIIALERERIGVEST